MKFLASDAFANRTLNALMGSQGEPKGATIDLTAAQLNHLQSSPVTLIPAPGPGAVAIVTGYSIRYSFGTAGYGMPRDTIGAYYGGCHRRRHCVRSRKPGNSISNGGPAQHRPISMLGRGRNTRRARKSADHPHRGL